MVEKNWLGGFIADVDVGDFVRRNIKVRPWNCFPVIQRSRCFTRRPVFFEMLVLESPKVLQKNPRELPVPVQEVIRDSPAVEMIVACHHVHMYCRLI